MRSTDAVNVALCGFLWPSCRGFRSRWLSPEEWKEWFGPASGKAVYQDLSDPDGGHLRFARHPSAIGKRQVSTGQGRTGHEVSLPLWFASEYVPARRKLCTSFLEQPGI